MWESEQQVMYKFLSPSKLCPRIDRDPDPCMWCLGNGRRRLVPRSDLDDQLKRAMSNGQQAKPVQRKHPVLPGMGIGTWCCPSADTWCHLTTGEALPVDMGRT